MTESMSDEIREERARYKVAIAHLQSLMKQGLDVSAEIAAERRHHHSIEATLWKRAHPERARATARRYRAAHPEQTRKLEMQYRKAHPEKHALAMRRWNARRKILQEFMAIDHTAFQ